MFYYLKKNWKISLFVCLIQVSLWGMQAAIQLLLMETFDAAMALKFNTFMYWTMLSLLFWGVYFIFGIAQGYFQAKAIRVLNNQVRYDLYLSLLNRSYNDYHALDSGSYISWLTNNIKQIENLAWNPFFNGVGRVAQIIWSMIALTLIDWTLLVASLVIALIMWYMPKLFEKKMESMGSEYSSEQAIAVGRMRDLISGLYVLRLFGKESTFLKKGNMVSEQIEFSSFRFKYTQSTIGSLIGFINVSLQLIASVLIVLLSFEGRIRLAVMAGGSNLISGVSNGFSSIADFRLSIAASKSYFMKINTNTQKNLTIKKDTHNSKLIKESIELDNVSFYYGTKAIIRDVSLRFEKGRKYALVGPSGCGKTTLLKLILGWFPDYSGTIKYDGVNAKEYSIEQIQQEISYIEQDVFLFNTTIIENITLGEQFPKSDLEKVIRDSSLEDDLANMPDGLETIVGEDGKNISGGQKQRIAIARALIHNHSILLVDEGTSALDQENADIVEQSLLMNPNITLILVSHHLTLDRRNQFDYVYEFKNEK